MRDLSLWISGCGVGSVVAEHAVSCSMARGILVPWPGTEPASPASQGGFLITQPPGESPDLTVISLSSSPNMSVIFMNKCFLWVQVNERKWEHDAFRKWPRFHCSAAASWPEDRQQVSDALTSPSWGFSQCFLSVKLLPQPKHCVGNMGMGCQVWRWILITSYSVSSGKIGHGLCHEGKAMCCWGKDTWCGITHNACARRGFFWGADKIPRTIILSDLAEKRPTNCQLVSKLDTRG